jgi:hypothetical protein
MATIAHSEDVVFDALWNWVQAVTAVQLPGDLAPGDQVFKGFQNTTATRTGNYVVLSPGVKQRQDQGRRSYVPDTLDPSTGVVNIARHTTYSYQVDCYGQLGADVADIISIAWRSLWGCDQLTGAAITPLYADEPQQLNVVNSENIYEQRFMLRLFAQVNQVVTLPQDFFNAVELHVEPPVDMWPDLPPVGGYGLDYGNSFG